MRNDESGPVSIAAVPVSRWAVAALILLVVTLGAFAAALGFWKLGWGLLLMVSALIAGITAGITGIVSIMALLRIVFGGGRVKGAWIPVLALLTIVTGSAALWWRYKVGGFSYTSAEGGWSISIGPEPRANDEPRIDVSGRETQAPDFPYPFAREDVASQFYTAGVCEKISPPQAIWGVLRHVTGIAFANPGVEVKRISDAQAWGSFDSPGVVGIILELSRPVDQEKLVQELENSLRAQFAPDAFHVLKDGDRVGAIIRKLETPETRNAFDALTGALRRNLAKR
jgi:hypothetical protein